MVVWGEQEIHLVVTKQMTMAATYSKYFETVDEPQPKPGSYRFTWDGKLLKENDTVGSRLVFLTNNTPFTIHLEWPLVSKTPTPSKSGNA